MLRAPGHSIAGPSAVLGAAVLLAALSSAGAIAADPGPKGAAPTTAGTVASSASEVRPLDKGAAAPAFEVRRPDGTVYRFAAGPRAAPAVLLFYRGGWCPFCNVHLGQLKAAEATLRQRGYEMLFLSSDRPEILRSSLKDDIEQETAHYTLLSDAPAVAARALGIAFRVDDATVAQYKGFGVDLESTQGNDQHVLPVPAVFVVDRTGRIAFSHFNPDYKVRLSADELLAAAP
jgi:peroxiredoxin